MRACRQPALDRGHRLGVQPLRVARTFRTRFDGDVDERAIGRALHGGLARRDDQARRVRRLRRRTGGDQHRRRRDKDAGAAYAPHTILNPTL